MFREGVDIVSVDAVVLDKKGEPIEGLTAQDFAVFEDGKPQALTSFQAVVLPETPPSAAAAVPAKRTRVSTNQDPPPARSFIIVFDDAHLTPQQADRAKSQLGEFLRQGFRLGDEVIVVPTAGSAWWSARMPEGHSDLVAVLARLKGQRHADYSAAHMTDYEAMRLYVGRDRQIGAQVIRRYYDAGVLADLPPTPGEGGAREDLDLGEGHPQIRAKAAQVYHDATARNKLTLRALERAADAVAGRKGRKAVLLVSPGFVHDTTLPGFRAVIQACRRANAAIYFLDARGLTLPGTSDAERGIALEDQDISAVLSREPLESQGAESLAVDSGGLVVTSNDVTLGLRRIARESRSYYLLGYQTTNTKRDGKLRKIKVEVKRENVEVRARKGYYALDKDRERREEPAGESLDPVVRSAMDSPYTSAGIPLRLASYVLGPSDSGKSTVLLVAEADARTFDFKAEKDRFVTALDSYIIVTSREQGVNERQEKRIDLSLPQAVRERVEKSGLPVMRTLELRPGAHQARLLLRDLGSGRLGTVRHDFDVPPADGFRITTPILTDVLEPGPAGSVGRPVPLARREFVAGSRLIHFFEIYGAARGTPDAKPRVTVTYALRSADGREVANMGPAAVTVPEKGPLAQQTILPLEGLTPGRYELRVTVKDDVGQHTLEATDFFDVIAAVG